MSFVFYLNKIREFLLLFFKKPIEKLIFFLLFTSLQKIQFTNGIHKLNESIDELNKQLIESRNVHDQLNADFEKIYQENNELRQKYAQTHDSLLDTQNSFNTYKGKNCRFFFKFF